MRGLVTEVRTARPAAARAARWMLAAAVVLGLASASVATSRAASVSRADIEKSLRVEKGTPGTAILPAPRSAANNPVTVVRPGNLAGWDISNYDYTVNPPDGDKIGDTPTARGTSAEFVTGAGSPPGGSGSLFQHVGDSSDPPSGDDATRLRTSAYNGMLLSDISALSYWTYVSSFGSGGQATYIQIRVDFDGDGVTDDVLFFEPVYQTGAYSMITGPPVPNQGQPVLGTWQYWNALIGGWWTNNESAGGPPLITIADYIAEHPGVKIATDTPSIRLTSGFGGGAWAGFRGNTDLFTLNKDVYDFEAPPMPVHNLDSGMDFPTIQAAINDPNTANGHHIQVDPGTYPENVTLNKSLTLRGAQAGVSACGRVTGAPDPSTESIIAGPGPTLLTLVTGCAGSVIDGFSFSGGSRQIESTSGPLDNLAVKNNHFTGFTGNALFLNDNGTDVTLDANNVDAGSQTSGDGSIHLDTDTFAGFYLTNNCIGGAPNAPNGTGFYVDGNHNVKPSAGRAPLVSGNIIEKHTTNAGANFGRFAFTGGTISNNQFRDNAADGLQGGVQSSSITGNGFRNNGGSGLALTGFGGAGDATRGAQHCTITGNTFSNNGTQGVLFSSGQFPGTVSTNVVNYNDIVGNAVGVRYGGTETIDVKCNWWGDISGPTYPSGNPTGTGDKLVATNATFTPWLDGSITGSPSCNQFPPTPTTTTLSSSVNPATCGQAVTLTATVSPSAATGTVEFFDDGNSLGTAPVASGTATLPWTAVAGYRTLTAQYSGDADYLASTSNKLVEQVDCPAGQVTTVSPTPCDSMGWFRANIQSGGTVDMTTTYPQSGYGSLEFNTTGSGSKADFIRVNGGQPLLSTVSALAVDLYRNSSSTAAAHLAPAVRMFVDNGQTLNRYSLLIWEPVYNGVPSVPTDSWNSYSLIKGNFWQRAFRTTGGKTIDLYNRTLADWLAPGFVVDGGGDTSNVVGPDAKVVWFEIGVGSGWTGTFHGAADNFHFGFSGVDTVFNFEPRVPTSTTLASDFAKVNWGDKVTLTATVNPSTATGTVEFADQNGTPADFQGFETDLGGDPGWDHGPGQYTATRVASGTNGVTSRSGSFHAEAGQYNLDQDGGSAFTRWGGYNSTFPAGGYTTTVDVYLDVAVAAAAGDKRIDFSSAINDNTGSFHRDFVFNLGTEATGFVVTAGNNAGRGSANPADPGHDPVHLTQTGWYTLKHRFYNDGGVLACDLSIIDPNGNVIVGGPAWTRKNPADAISGIGGNRYGWFAAQELPFLAIDNATRTEGSLGKMAVVNGVATLSLSDLAVGSHTLVATYQPDACYLASSSGKVAVEVNRAPTTTTLGSSANPAKYGTKITFTATVDPAGASGTVEFFDGATSLGVENLVNGMASVSVTGLPNGHHSITAVYSGDEHYLGSTSDKLDQVVADENAPVVTVIAPNGGEILVVGAPTKVAWTAGDDKGVTSIDLYVSRDNGATYQPVVLGLGNSGTYTWTVPGPGDNTDATVVYKSFIQVRAHDAAGNVGTDESDAAFAIYDLATETLLSLFHAAPVEQGVELRWQFGTVGLFSAVGLERSPAATGPWAVVAAELRQEGEVTVALDRGAVAGQAYYYRLVGSLPGGGTMTFGPLAATAGSPVREFALTSVVPNPSAGPMRIDFALPREAQLRLSVLDVQGRVVAELASGRFQPGRYQAVWNGRTERGEAPAGVYFVRYQVAGQDLVKRVVYSK